MNLNGKITLFVEKSTIKVEGNDKEIVKLSTTISHKQDDGSYLNKKVDVNLSKKKFPDEAVAKLDANECYTMEVYDGFLSVRSWKDRHQQDRREVVIVVNDGKLTGHKKVEKKVIEVADSDLPF